MVKAQAPSLINRIVDASTIKSMGGNPEASFFVDLMPGVLAGGFDATGPLAKPAKYKGMHGYFPTAATMQSTFFIKGPGIARHRSLGEIDMRSIAPTLARIMGSSLPDAERPELPLGR